MYSHLAHALQVAVTSPANLIDHQFLLLHTAFLAACILELLSLPGFIWHLDKTNKTKILILASFACSCASHKVGGSYLNLPVECSVPKQANLPLTHILEPPSSEQ